MIRARTHWTTRFHLLSLSTFSHKRAHAHTSSHALLSQTRTHTHIPTATPKPKCPFYNAGSPEINSERILSKQQYHDYLAKLDIAKLYKTITHVMKSSDTCWPADGPQDNDVASYAGLFGRLAWHCSGTLRIDEDHKKSYGGCEGGRNRFWPEREWRDNDNLDKARAILAKVKNVPEFKDLSWGGKLHLYYASSQHTHARLPSLARTRTHAHTHTHTHTQIS